MGEKTQAEKDRIRAREYQRSKRGKIVRKRWLAKNHDSVRQYTRDFFRKRYEQAEKLGLCAACLKMKQPNGTVFCDKCRERIRLNSELSRARNRKLYKQVNQLDKLRGVS
jgi:hypothetical protein